ncbi:MAG: TM2 domain-containing protein [Gracilimonas sp.]|jgi:TM2 domain-containing membrane protein YozV|nr:TM2 domain-containing protein [Gracilimonas sp.]
MRKSEQYEMALAAENSLQKAANTYQNLIDELSENGEETKTALLTCLHDSVRNLNRKIEAYFQEQITMERVVEEFVFEYQVLEDELGEVTEESVRTKKFARKLLTSYEDFISKVGGKKKLSLIHDRHDPDFESKSKGKAYLFWFVGFFGILGFHRFYLGRIGTGIGWLLSGGILGLGAIYDLFALSQMVDEQNTYNELKAAKIKQLSGK